MITLSIEALINLYMHKQEKKALDYQKTKPVCQIHKVYLSESGSWLVFLDVSLESFISSRKLESSSPMSGTKSSTFLTGEGGSAKGSSSVVNKKSHIMRKYAITL